MNYFQRGIRLTAAVITASGVLVATPAYAAPSNITKYPIATFNITDGPDGNMWFTASSDAAIGKITPAGVTTEYQPPSAHSTLFGITSGPDGNVWFTESRFDIDKIGKSTPDGHITEYPLGHDVSPSFITKGTDGNVWFTESNANKIGRITPSGSITEYPLPHSLSDPKDIISGPDGNLWFTEYLGGRVGKITPTGNITEYSLANDKRRPYSITNGPDGSLWFTEWDDEIGRITVDGNITQYPVIGRSSLTSVITSGSDGNLWFADAIYSRISRLTTGGDVVQYSFADIVPFGINGLTTSHDGYIWVTAPEGILRFDPRIPPIPIPEYGIPEAAVACFAGLALFAFWRHRHITLIQRKDL